MNLKKYQKLCQKTAAQYQNKEKEILTWGLGIAGEAGDVAGCIKKPIPIMIIKSRVLKKI